MSTPTSKRRMERRTTVNIMLYIGVFAMAMLTYYDYQERQSEPDGIETFQTGETSSVSIHRPGHRTTVLQKRPDGDWFVVNPIERRAQRARVEALLTITNVDAGSAYSAEQLDLRELGLETPAATVDLTGESGEVRVILGGLGPNNQRRYLQIGTQIWLIDDVFFPLIAGGLAAFADLQIVPADQVPASLALDGKPSSLSESSQANWSNSNAAGILPLDELESGDAISLIITRADGVISQWKLVPMEKQFGLVPEQSDYAFILTASQAERLGLAR